MGIYSYGYKAAKTPIGKKVVDTVKNIFTGGKQKATGTEVINKVDPFVPQTKAEISARDLRRATQKRKTSEVKLDNTLFRINQEAKKLKEGRVYSGKELEQQKYFNDMNKNKKAKGGRIGYKRGTGLKRKSNVEKIKETFSPKNKIKFDAKKSDLDKSGDLSKYEKARGMAIAKAMAKRKNKKVI